MFQKKLVSICSLVVLVTMACGIVEANWSDDFNDMAFDQTWKWERMPSLFGTFTKGVIVDGPASNDYLEMEELYGPIPPQYGAAFGGGFVNQNFTDVRVGAVVGADGHANDYPYCTCGLLARTNYFVDPTGGDIRNPFGAPGVLADCYAMLITWGEEAPSNIFGIEVQKIRYDQNWMRSGSYFTIDLPDANVNRSYYAELDVVGSNPVYVTGSLYEYKGGPLVARLPTMIDTDAQDWWEDPDWPDTTNINEVHVMKSGVSGVTGFNENEEPPVGWNVTFDDVYSISDGPAAVNPSPADGTTDVSLNADMSWKEAAFATSRDLWLGKQGAMKKVTPSPAGATYDPGTLKLGRTYQWRVDEIGAAATVTGHLWSFSTIPCLVVDDFESYTNSDPNIIYKTWKDGLGYNPPGNGTGSKAGYRDPDYAEVTIVHEGRQSLPVDYNNTKLPYYSEVDRTFDTPQDWTAYGVKALTLWLRGYPSVPAGTFVESPPGTYTMTASGTDIGDVPDLRKPLSYHDEFHYAYTQANGNCWIEAKVQSVSNTDPWAKAGIMMRDSTDPNSVHAMAYITPANGVAFQYRATTGGAITNINQSGITAPYWVGINRVGDGFTAYYSPDGTSGSWVVLSGASIPMPDPVCIGLALTSHNAAAVCTAAFSNVSTSAGTSPSTWTSVDIGMKSNTVAPLYVTLQDSGNNSATVTNPDPNTVLTNTWQPWDIALSDFADVNLAAIKKITIGVGNRAAPQLDGTGTIYVDDIRLYPPRCMPDRVKAAGDFTSDCFADYADLDKIAEQWLASGSNLEADANYDNNVNFKDYAVLADVWLEEVLWP